MPNSEQAATPITSVISQIVKPDRVQEYEDWMTGINQAVKQFAGFLGVDIIRPRDQSHPEYVTIVKFDTYDHLKQWLDSPTFREWVAKSRDLISGEPHVQEASGVELWFQSPADTSRASRQPARYKLVVVGIIAVYPLILLSSVVLGPVLRPLPFPLSMLILVVPMSVLMTYLVTPSLTRVFKFWLYPT